MAEFEYTKFLQVMFQYGLRPAEWVGDHIILRNSYNDIAMVLSGEVDVLIPVEALEEILAHVGMNSETFWQLYATV